MSLMDVVNLVKITTIPNLVVDSPTKQIYTKYTEQNIFTKQFQKENGKQRCILDE